MKHPAWLALVLCVALCAAPFSTRAEDAVKTVGPNKLYDEYKFIVMNVKTRIKIDDSVSAHSLRAYSTLPNKFPIMLDNGTVVTAYKLGNGDVEYSGGSGWLYDKEGTLITDGHVVRVKNDELNSYFGTMKISEYTYSASILDKEANDNARHRKYDAKLLGVDLDKDLAALKVIGIDPKNYGVGRIGDPDKLAIGETLHALGCPYGFPLTWSDGKVRALHRQVGMWRIEDFVQNDVVLNHGNSGCPIMNDAGEIVAMCDLGKNGLQLCTSIKLLDVDSLKKAEGGVVKHGWFGAEAVLEDFERASSLDRVKFEDIETLHKETGFSDVEALVALAKLTKDRWSVVNSIETEKDGAGNAAPAQSVKLSNGKTTALQKGDIVTEINGKNVRGGMEMRIILATIPIGKEFEVAWKRVDPETAIVTEFSGKVTLIEKKGAKNK